MPLKAWLVAALGLGCLVGLSTSPVNAPLQTKRFFRALDS
jgi:hypothetical protein